MKSEVFRQPISLYLSTEHQCSYLEQHSANSLFVDPGIRMRNDIYASLIQQGFRRSGNYIYTPYCKTCHECISVRINVLDFKPGKTLRRCWKQNSGLRVHSRPAVYVQEHFELYADYLGLRHPGGGMDQPTKDKYLDFLTSDWSKTSFLEFREEDKVVAVAVTDRVQDGLSSVYTFFHTDPRYRRRSLGNYAILRQIQEAREAGLRWVYLGYWVRECNKMNYKSRFQPLEYFYDNGWHTLPPAQG